MDQREFLAKSRRRVMGKLTLRLLDKEEEASLDLGPSRREGRRC